MVVDMYLTNNKYDDCLLANFKCPDILHKNDCARVLAPFTLGEWLVIDGITKLLYLAVMLLLIILDTEIHSIKLSIMCAGMIRAFYTFQLGWNITASILFWAEPPYDIQKRDYLNCKSPFQI